MLVSSTFSTSGPLPPKTSNDLYWPQKRYHWYHCRVWKTSFSNSWKRHFHILEKMFKRYSKNGGETSTFCLVAVRAREAERLPSLRLEYDLDRNCKKNRRDLSGLAFGIIWYHSMFPPRQFSPRSVRFEVSEVMTSVMRVSLRFSHPALFFVSCREQVSTPSHSLFGITGIAGITEYQSERAGLSRLSRATVSPADAHARTWEDVAVRNGNTADHRRPFILERIATVLRWKSPNHPFFLASGKRTECRPESPALRRMIAWDAPSISSPWVRWPPPKK